VKSNAAASTLSLVTGLYLLWSTYVLKLVSNYSNYEDMKNDAKCLDLEQLGVTQGNWK